MCAGMQAPVTYTMTAQLWTLTQCVSRPSRHPCAPAQTALRVAGSLEGECLDLLVSVQALLDIWSRDLPCMCEGLHALLLCLAQRVQVC